MTRKFAFALAALCLLSIGADAQAPDPSGKALPDLLYVPKDATGYYDIRTRAEALNDAKEYAKAEPLAERLVREYPRDPENWVLLGRIKRSLNKHLEAAKAFEKAEPLIGYDVEYPNAYRAAVGYLKAGRKKESLAILRKVILEQHGFYRTSLYSDDWLEFAPLRNDPEFREIVGHPDTTGWSREKGWAYDIDFLYNEVKRVNPDYRDLPFPPEVQKRYADLKRDAPGLNDAQIYFRMREMLSPLNQGHLDFWPAPNSKYLPLRFYVFPEGIFIIGANAPYENLIGARVVTIGALPAEEAWRRLCDASSKDGDMECLWQVSSLAETGNLKGMGAISSQEMVPLELEMRGAKQSVTVAATATAPPNDQNARWDRLAAAPGVTPPLFLSDMKHYHWEKSIPEHRALYVQINNLIDTPEETLPDYGKRLWTVVEKENPDNLILDLRHNNGGNTLRYTEVLRTIIAFSRTPGHKVYVLIGRRTYSASGNFITDLERLVNPVFAGEASSECCHLHGDPAEITLPYSKVQLEATAVRWQLSSPSDLRREINPTVPVQMTARDYFGGTDPVLEAVYRIIDADKAKQAAP